MTVNDNEMLSALVDGELQGKELDQTLHVLSTDKQARERLQRYQLVSDVLHGHAIANQNVDLTGRISAALAEEVAPMSTSLHKQRAKVLTFPKQFWKHTAGLAVAASIGALAVIGIMTQPQNQLVPVAPIASVAPVAEQTVIAQTGNHWTVGEPEVENRLNTYLVDHHEYAGVSDVFSYARVVAYEVGQ